MENKVCREKRRSSILKAARSPTRNPLIDCNVDNQEKRKSLGNKRVSFADKHEITEFDRECSKDLDGPQDSLQPIDPNLLLNSCIPFSGLQASVQPSEFKENCPSLHPDLMNTTMATKYFNESMLCDFKEEKTLDVEPKLVQQNQHNITDNLLKDMSLTLTISTAQLPFFCEPAPVLDKPVVEERSADVRGLTHESVEVTRLEPSEISSFSIPAVDISDMMLSRAENGKIVESTSAVPFHEQINCNQDAYEPVTLKESCPVSDSSMFAFPILGALELPKMGVSVTADNEPMFCSLVDLELTDAPLLNVPECSSSETVKNKGEAETEDLHGVREIQKDTNSGNIIVAIRPSEIGNNIADGQTVCLNEPMELDSFVKTDRATDDFQLPVQETTYFNGSIEEESAAYVDHKSSTSSSDLEPENILPGLEEEIKTRLESDLVVSDWAYEVERLSQGLVRLTCGCQAFYLSVTFVDSLSKDDDPSVGRRMHNIKVLTSYPDDEFPENPISMKILNSHMNVNFEDYKHSSALPELLERLTDPFFRCHTLMQDLYMLRAYLASPLNFSDDGSEIQVRLVSTRVMVIIVLSFTIKFDTYPFSAIRPHFMAKSPEGSELRTVMMETMMQEKTGELYLWRMYKAARNVLRIREQNVTRDELKSLHSPLFLKHIQCYQ